YNVTMTVPATSRQTRAFEDRADALAHFFLRAGDAPRLIAYDDAVGCPPDQALALLEWTVAVGIPGANDGIHAARLGPESAAAGAVQRAGRERGWEPRHRAPDAVGRRLVRHGRCRRVAPSPATRRTLQLSRSWD